MSLFDKFADIEDRIALLEGRLADPSLVSQQQEYRAVVREHAELSRVNGVYSRYCAVRRELDDNRVLAKDEREDAELRELARAEIVDLEEQLAGLEHELKVLLLPRDPNDDRDILLEIRAGTGGDEAALFAGDLFRMYSRFAETQGWTVEAVSSNPAATGGFKEIIVRIRGEQVYSKLKYESGVHRVQRVPETETQGRIHTSAVTVAVLPEADEVDVAIAMHELKIDVYRSSGPGGQSVNTTDSAVRITHLPTGLVVTCQDEKSQHKNKAKALTVLRSRLLDKLQQEHDDRVSAERRSQVGSGDRSERIRTYNFPQGRLTDHRINLTLYKLDTIISGRLEEVILPLIAEDQAAQLKGLE